MLSRTGRLSFKVKQSKLEVEDEGRTLKLFVPEEEKSERIGAAKRVEWMANSHATANQAATRKKDKVDPVEE